MALTDSEILHRAQQEVVAASGRNGGELAQQRADAMDYYLGEPYGDEQDGRSRVVTRETLETIEWILPSLVRIFCDTDNLVVFEPVGPEDEEQAEQETDVCNHVYWKQNKGFYNTYTFLKDALLSKTGILKVWFDESKKEEREEYEGLDIVQLQELLSDPSVKRQVIEAEQTPDGLVNVTFKAVRNKSRIRIEPGVPEEFGVSQDANSPYAKDARAVWQRTKKTKSELIQLGYDRKTVEGLPTEDNDNYGQERIARRNLADELDDYTDAPRSEYWITEAYIYADRDDDGIDELLKVTYAGGHEAEGSATLLDIEEVDRIPFATVSPIILTHKFYGLSLADITMDLQRIKSTLLRGVLDNVYNANNGKTAANDEYVNMDDLLTSRPNQIIRVRGDQPIAAYLTPIPHAPLPAETFPLMEYIDQEIKHRSGGSEELASLDKTSLANVNTGVMAMAFDAARAKIELMARIIAEIGFVPLFRDIHELLMKHQDRAMTIKLRNKWVQTNPSEWRERENLTVKVGVGQVSRERTIMAMEAVMARQEQIVQGGGLGTMLTPYHLYQTHKTWAKAWGLEPDLYFPDPRTIPLPPPPPPDPNAQLAMMQGQAMMLDAQSKMRRAEVDAMKVAADERMQQATVALKLREMGLKSDIETLKRQLELMRSDDEHGAKVASIMSEQMKRDTENALKTLQMRLDAVQAEKQREFDIWKEQMDASLKLTELSVKESLETEKVAMQRAAQNGMAKEKAQESAKSEATELAQMLADIKAKLDAEDEEKPIVRDDRGLIVAIGKRKVKRDASGQAVSIG